MPAKKLHQEMLLSVLRAPLSFFELTPSGRIMNLFTRDTRVMDQVLGRVMLGVTRTAASMLMGILAVISTVFPLFLLAVPPLACLYNAIMA